MRKVAMGFRWTSASESALALIMAATFYAFGAVFGGILSAYLTEGDGIIVRLYMENLFTVLQNEFFRPSFFSFCFCVLRWVILAFSFGFSSAGVLFIPLLCFARGLLFSFSIGAFAWNWGTQGLIIAPFLLGISNIVAIPAFLLISTYGFLSAKDLLGRHLGIGRCEPFNRRFYYVRSAIITSILWCVLLLEWHFSPMLLSGVTALWNVIV